MKTRIIAFINALLLSLTLLTGCKNVLLPTPDEWQLGICGGYSIPGMYFSDYKYSHPKVNVIEQDSYGRVLFEFCFSNDISQKNEEVLVICQKNDRYYTYFYEDICFTYTNNDETELLKFKEINDWEESLDESKMSRRMAQVSAWRAILKEWETLDLSSVSEAVCKSFSIEKTQIKDLFVDDSDGEKYIYFLRLELDDGTMSEYFALFDKDYKFSTLEMKDGVVNMEELINFKKANGWKYGF